MIAADLPFPFDLLTKNIAAIAVFTMLAMRTMHYSMLLCVIFTVLAAAYIHYVVMVIRLYLSRPRGSPALIPLSAVDSNWIDEGINYTYILYPTRLHYMCITPISMIYDCISFGISPRL